jgi:uncharacterized RDD family membrane protein YckC
VAKYVKQVSRPQAPAPAAPAQSTAPPAPTTAAPAKTTAPEGARAPLKPPAPVKHVVPPGTTTGIEVTPRFFPLNWLMYFCFPHVDIDGEDHETAWRKTSFYPLLPGPYTVRIYVPYPSKPQAGLVSKKITVGEKAPCKINFYMGPLVAKPGSLTIDGTRSATESPKAQTAAPEASQIELMIRLVKACIDSMTQNALLRRLGAACIDSMILSLCLGLLITLISLGTGVSLDALRFNMFIHLGVQLALWLYFALLESSSWQSTFGKKVLNLQVTDYDDNRISFGMATLRHVARLLLLPGTLFIGFLMIAFTERKQGLHDLVSKCLVVHSG